MKQQILDKVEACFLTAENYYKQPFPRPTNIEFRRSGTTGGRCTMNYSKTKRELMFQLDLAEHHPEDYENTVTHEVAHYVQFFLYLQVGKKLRPHGYEWEYIMTRVYGIPADRCHNYDTTVTKVKRELRHIYTCGCNTEFAISTTMHNHIQNGLKGIQQRRWNARLGRYVYRSGLKICSRCGDRIYLKQLGDPNQKRLEDLQRELKVIQARLERTLAPVPTFNF
jgi:SprT protein